MVKQFLKIAGVKTQAEFYKKYPSEEAFFKAHPEARNLVNQKMAYGGIYAYGGGGFYPGYQTGGPTVPPLMEQFDNDPASYQEALYNYMLSQEQPVVGPSQAGVIPVGAPPIGTVSTPLPTEMLYNMANDYQEPASSKYQGVSIVDMLASKGKSDFGTRKEIAKALGIKGYTGSASQNRQMIDLLNQNPDVLNQIVVAPKAIRSSKKSEQQQEKVESTTPSVEESINFSVQYPEAFSTAGSKEGKDDNLVPLIIGALSTAAATGATSAGLINYNKLMDGINSGQYKFGKSAKAALTKSINKLKTASVETAGKDIKVQSDWYKKLPKQHQAILKSLDAAEIPGDIHIMPKGTASRDMYTRDMLNEAKAENLIASQYQNQKALQEAEQEAAALRRARGAKAAAARWGTKAAETEKALGLGSRIAKGARAFQNLKYIKPVSDLIRGVFKEDGGENNYSGTYSGGVYYQEGGAYIPEYGDNAYGVLPKFGMGAMGVPPAMYGLGMRDGGQNNTLQKFVNAGYSLDYLAEGGPTYSKVTAYNHQGIVPAFDWLKEGGPTFSKRTGYPHQQYVPALDWLQEGGGAPMPPASSQSSPQQVSPQQGQQQGPDPQQIMQAVSQMIQQGTEPGQILQELVKAGIPQEVAQQIIQQVMQQMQGAQQPQQAGPMMRSGGLVKGSVHDVSEEDVQDLINKGYKIQYL